MVSRAGRQHIFGFRWFPYLCWPLETTQIKNVNYYRNLPGILNFWAKINSSHNCEIYLCMSSVKKQIDYFFFDNFDQFSASTFPLIFNTHIPIELSQTTLISLRESERWERVKPGERSIYLQFYSMRAHNWKQQSNHSSSISKYECKRWRLALIYSWSG